MSYWRRLGIIASLALAGSSCVFTVPLDGAFFPVDEFNQDSSFSYREQWTISDDGTHRLRSTRATSEFFQGEASSRTERVVVESVTGEARANFSGRNASITDDGSLVAFELLPFFGFDDPTPAVEVLLGDVATGTTLRVSEGVDGSAPDGDSGRAVISGDGSTIAFFSAATNLVEPPTTGVQVFAYDVATGGIRLVSTPAAGGTSVGTRFIRGSVRISDDGSVIAFSTTASDLVDDDTNETTDVFRVVDGGPVERVVSATSGSSPDGAVTLQGLSGDGSTIGISSAATNLTFNDPPGSDLFLVDDDGEIERIERPSGVDASDFISIRDLSDDGSLVLFRWFDRNLTVESGFSQNSWSFSRAALFDRQSGEVTPVRGPGSADYEGAAGPSMTGDGRLVLVSDARPIFSPNSLGFEVTHHLQAAQELRIDTVEPAVLPAGATTRVTVRGAGFTEELAGLVIPVTDIGLDAVSVVEITDRTALILDITIPAGAPTGPAQLGISSFADTAVGTTFLSADACECISVAP